MTTCGKHPLQFASEDLKNDREIALEEIKQNGLALRYSSEDLRNDREVVLFVCYKIIGLCSKYALVI